MVQARCGLVGLGLLFFAALAFADLPFGSGFETGKVCDWAAGGEGLCLTEAEMAAGLVGDYPVCIPPTPVDLGGFGSAVVCAQSLCSGGAPGCDAMVHVTSTTFVLATSSAAFTSTLDNDVFPTRVTTTFPPATYDCNLNVTNGTGTGTISFTTLPACFPGMVEVATVPGTVVDLNATLAFSDCAIAGLLNALLPSLQPTLFANAEAQLAETIRLAAEAAWVGRWVCTGG